MQCLQKYVPENKPTKITNAITNITTLYIIAFGNVLSKEDPSDLDDVDSIWFWVTSYDTSIDFEGLIFSEITKNTICQL